MSGQASDWAPIRLSTSVFPKRARLAAMQDIYANTIAKSDVRPLGEAPVDFEATIYRLPGVTVAMGGCTGFAMHRGRVHANPDDLLLSVCLTGGALGSEAGREVQIGAGDAYLRTCGAGECIIQPGTRFLNLRMDSSILAPLLANIDDVLLRRIPAETPALKMLVAYSRVLQDASSLHEPELRRTFATHFSDLVVLALGATRDAAEAARHRGTRAARLRAVKADIGANFDCKLSVAELAARHCTTPRSIQLLFEAEGTTCTEYMIVQRLARAHRMLTDPRRAGDKIAVIAGDAGFGDLSYFNRAFRRRYGVTPSQVRVAGRESAAAA